MREAEGHLETCSYCRKRYKFEQSLRRYVRQIVEPMPLEMKARLSDLAPRALKTSRSNHDDQAFRVAAAR